MEALRLLASWDVQEKILHMCGVSLHVHTLRRSQGQRQEKSGSFHPQWAQLEMLSPWMFFNHFPPLPEPSREVGEESGVSDESLSTSSCWGGPPASRSCAVIVNSIASMSHHWVVGVVISTA